MRNARDPKIRKTVVLPSSKKTVWLRNAIDVMRHEGVNPLQILARCAKGDPKVTFMQLQAAKELAKYGWSQKVSVDGGSGLDAPQQPVVINISTLSLDELRELRRLQEKMQPAIEAKAE